ncbi:2-hydroxymuconate tautomerase [Chloroflexota bacterium]
MPLITVKVLEGKTVEQKRALVKDITEAVVKDFEVPANAVTIDIIDCAKENLAMGGTLFTDR